MANTDLMTTAEAADRLGVNTRMVARLVERGDLTPEKKLPGLRGPFLFAVDDIERYAERTRDQVAS